MVFTLHIAYVHMVLYIAFTKCPISFNREKEPIARYDIWEAGKHDLNAIEMTQMVDLLWEKITWLIID